jgi:hypothetical protein
MKKSTRRWMGMLALTAGTLGAAGAFLMKKKSAGQSARDGQRARADVWARPGMSVTFRAERTFRVAELLPSGRVRLEGVAGEHNEKEFEPIR